MTSPSSPAPHPVASVVLAGGRATRLGGCDKTRVDLPGGSPLSRVLSACPPGPRIVVGPATPAGAEPGVCRVREDPPGAGPVAALAAGLEEARGQLGPAASQADVLVLAGDLPHLRRATLEQLRGGGPHEAARTRVVRCARDEQGRLQYLCSAWPLELLAASLRTAAASHDGGLAGIGMHRLFAELPPTRLALVDLPGPQLEDIDTPDDLDRARALRAAERHPEETR